MNYIREWVAVNKGDRDNEEKKIIDEINRKYEGHSGEADSLEGRKRVAFFIRLTAFFLALIFLFTVTGRWLTVFSGPVVTFLRESWELNSDPMVSELRNSVVQVHIETKSGTSGGQLRGSGFNIAPEGLVITNRHLVEDAAIIRVSFPGYGTFIAAEWIVSPDVDLALVLFEAEELPVLSITDQPLTRGEELLVIGNPLQFTRIANRGILAGYRSAGNRDLPLLVVSAHIYPGSSGSPVFNMEGEVTGVIFALLRSEDPAQTLGLAVSAEELMLFLQDEGFD
ncbi:MAG: S1C family serine protease [Dethiobacteria bacterium]|nr:serine protease [Bacillota bacterium]MDW7730186.1 serine protease [Bacillota bacterium]